LLKIKVENVIARRGPVRRRVLGELRRGRGEYFWVWWLLLAVLPSLPTPPKRPLLAEIRERAVSTVGASLVRREEDGAA